MPRTRTRPRGRLERGIAIIVTALVLIPLMSFAAFAVDLASWYARVTEIQRAADAAALAGAPWMPDLAKARTEANASLRSNGFVHGVDAIETSVERGATATSVRVTVTDTDADRYFSQVISPGRQRLSRSAEAEYNLPLPLGSPLNYFGGDATQTGGFTDQVQQTVVNWPADHSTRAPVNPPCNVGTSAAQGVGRWTSSTTFDPNGFSGSTRCFFEARYQNTSGTTTTAPPDYDRTSHLPTNVPCNAFAAGTNGRWTGTQANPAWDAGGRTGTGPAGQGNRACTWTNHTTTSVPSATFRSNAANVNAAARPCNLGYQDVGGRWPASGAYETGSRYTGLHTAGNRLCQFVADVVTQTVTVPRPNPIPADRSPGFWAMVYGPGQYAANGDAYSSRCTQSYNCSSTSNQMYVDTSNPNRGFWYVIEVPAGVTGTIDVNVFDASFNIGGERVMDSTENGGSPSTDADFQTEFRVFRQTNPLDFTMRSNLFGGTASQSAANGGCWWQLRDEAAFHGAWARLCSITGVQGGDRYLINVRTNAVTGENGAGNNGYALEAVLNGNRYADPGPSLYAFSSMGLANQNNCTGTGCTPQPATFYLAKVGPEHAGKVLVIELFDAGDMSGTTNAHVYPMRPSPTAPRPVQHVAATDCTWTAVPDPNPTQSPSFEAARTRTGVRIAPTDQPSDTSPRCGVQTSISGTRQFNGEWLRIRVEIPSTYTCDVTVNDPEDVADSCWWGIRYEFANGGASDITTWQARVEGNPLQLTQ